MKLKYSKDVDILMMELSKTEPIEFAEKMGNVIVHFNKRRQPVALEILDASSVFRQAYRVLPQETDRADRATVST